MKDVQVMIAELGAITVLWDEQWLSTLQDLHAGTLHSDALSSCCDLPPPKTNPGSTVLRVNLTHLDIKSLLGNTSINDMSSTNFVTFSCTLQMSCDVLPL